MSGLPLQEERRVKRLQRAASMVILKLGWVSPAGPPFHRRFQLAERVRARRKRAISRRKFPNNLPPFGVVEKNLACPSPRLWIPWASL
jgi:hypothetical protein